MLLETIPSSMSSTLRSKRFSYHPVGYAILLKRMKFFQYMMENFECESACEGKRNSVDSEKLTPLHLAALLGNCEAVELLMSLEKVDKTPKTSIQATPLHSAAMGGSLEVVKLLLKYKSTRIDARNALNETPFHYAALHGKANIVEFMMKNVKNKSPKCRKGYDPLHRAAKKGRLDCVKVMLSEGIDCYSRKPSSGNTALHLATRNNHFEVISALLEHNPALSDEHNNMGHTAFHEAVRKGKVECVKHLLRHGINQNVKTNNNILDTSLHIAVRNSRLKVIRVLLEDPLIEDQPDKYGMTALHVAAQKGKVDYVEKF